MGHTAMESTIIMTAEQRTFTRLPFERRVQWSDGAGDNGAATVQNLGRAGLSCTLSRYLRPGRVVSLQFGDIVYRGAPIRLMAEVVWCHSAAPESSAFDTGFRMIYPDGETLGAVSEVFYAALHALRDSAAAYDTHIHASGALLAGPSCAS